jgi:hypothetical protein
VRCGWRSAPRIEGRPLDLNARAVANACAIARGAILTGHFFIIARCWGKAVQPHSGEDGGDIHVIIRHIVDTTGDTEPVLIDEPALIEHEPDRGSR